MDCSTPGFPALHYLLEFAQTDARRVADAIQPSHHLFYIWFVNIFSHSVGSIFLFIVYHVEAFLSDIVSLFIFAFLTFIFGVRFFLKKSLPTYVKELTTHVFF